MRHILPYPSFRIAIALLLIAAPFAAAIRWGKPSSNSDAPKAFRKNSKQVKEVTFWHFWGGSDAQTVENVVRQFNASQSVYRVRPIAMPGNNLDLKLFLAITGGSPPDLVNQDDPVLGDWVYRSAVIPIDQIAGSDACERLERWLYPTARSLGQVQGRSYAICNGLDLRALYFNQDLLEQFGLQVPKQIQDLDDLAHQLTMRDQAGRLERVGFLPDSRRWWAWGTVFGASWQTSEGAIRLTEPRAVEALRWMDQYQQRLGASNVLAFRQADQSLPGKTFPLLAGRYAAVMDGQWRVRDIAAYNQEQLQRGETPTRFGVCSLPPPTNGRPDAGWLNGNFFLIPKGSRQPEGAFEFAKYWIGFDGHAEQAAKTCASGGWIPVAKSVTEHPVYQRYLDRNPLMKPFIRLAASEHQLPYPMVPSAALLRRTVEAAGSAVMTGQQSPQEAALESQRRIDAAKDRL